MPREIDPRPTRSSPAVIEAAAKEIVAKLIAGGHVKPCDEETAVAEISGLGPLSRDGYDFATQLDECCHWDCDFAMAQILNRFSDEVYDALREALRGWGARCGLQPPFPLGARVALPSKETGEITGIYDHGAAQYLIKVDNDPKAAPPHESRRIVNFEDVTALEVT